MRVVITDILPGVQRNGTDTSYEAADTIGKVSGKMRLKVYAFIGSRGSYGATDDEIVLAFAAAPGKPSSYRKRRPELTHLGLVYDTGRRRLNQYGNNCIVWAVR